MKEIKLLCLVCAAMLLTVGCTSDNWPTQGFPELPEIINTKGESDEPAATVRLDADQLASVKAILDAASGSMLQRASVDFYTKEGSGKWKKQNLDEWIGGELPGPSKMSLKDGKVWTPFVTFHCWGPHPVDLLLWVYRDCTGFDKQFFIGHDLEFDEEGSCLTIEDETFEICSASADRLCIRHISPFWRGGSDEVAGYHLYDLVYEKTDSDERVILYYDTELDASLAIIEMVRDRFGSQFNANHYLTGVVLDNPYVDLDEIEAQVRAMYAFPD